MEIDLEHPGARVARGVGRDLNKAQGKRKYIFSVEGSLLRIDVPGQSPLLPVSLLETQLFTSIHMYSHLDQYDLYERKSNIQ
uniref:Uncharacterized protein n=1 Tax=Strongyloides venezuelensis TaxID=75913 RepID=A0A0K0G5V1_STRVS